MVKQLPTPLPPWPSRPEFDAMPSTLRAAAEWSRFATGESLFKLGDKPQRLFFVVLGEVRLRRYSPDGTEIVLQRARNSFLAEASIESKNYHCDAIAAEPAVTLSFPIQAFQQSIAECPLFRERWISNLLREVRRSRSQCERLVLRSAAARVLHYLDSEGSSGRVVLMQSKKAWAAELGLTHEALYRTLSGLVKDKKIVVDGETVYRA